MNEDGTPKDVLIKDSALHGCKTVGDAQNSSAYAAMLEAGLKAANKNAISRSQNVQKFAILPCDFTQDGARAARTCFDPRRRWSAEALSRRRRGADADRGYRGADAGRLWGPTWAVRWHRGAAADRPLASRRRRGPSAGIAATPARRND